MSRAGSLKGWATRRAHLAADPTWAREQQEKCRAAGRQGAAVAWQNTTKADRTERIRQGWTTRRDHHRGIIRTRF